MLKKINLIIIFAIFIVSVALSQTYIPMVINENCDHNNINTIFVEIDRNVQQQNIELYRTSWEESLMKAGYNIVTRTEIDVILKEHALAMSGLTNNEKLEKAGQIAGADGMLLYYRSEWEGNWIPPSKEEYDKVIDELFGDYFENDTNSHAVNNIDDESSASPRSVISQTNVSFGGHYERIRLIDLSTGQICFSVQNAFELTDLSRESLREMLNYPNEEEYILKYWVDSGQKEKGLKYLAKYYPELIELRKKKLERNPKD